MVGWLTKKFDNWAVGQQEKQILEFLNRLRAMDGEEIGLVVAIATDTRHLLEDGGHIVMDPIVYGDANPAFIFELSQSTEKLQKQGNMAMAGALMVWVHTLRAGIRGELRQYGRDMWRQLERGFPHTARAAIDAEPLIGTLNIEGYDEIPKGLTPDPL